MNQLIVICLAYQTTGTNAFFLAFASCPATFSGKDYIKIGSAINMALLE